MNNLTKLKSFLLVFFVSVVVVPSHSIEAQASLPSQESPAHANYGSIAKTDPATPLPDALQKILDVVGKQTNPPSMDVSPYGYPPNPIYFSHMVFQAYTDQWEIRYGSPDLNNSSLHDLGWVIQHPSNDTQPRLNYGASKVVFVSDRFGTSDILSASFDGSNLIRLTNNSVPDAQPVWSPDNRQIAFVSYRFGNQDIYLMNEDGSNQRPLFFDPESDFNPSWSPDGSQLVFVTAVSPEYGQIWVCDTDGNNAHSVTPPLLYVSRPVWSPDGTMIGLDYDVDKDGFNEVAVMNADGTGFRTLPGQENNYLFYQDVNMGAWTPDSSAVVVSNLIWFYWDNTKQWYLTNTYIESSTIGNDPHFSSYYHSFPSMSPEIGLYDVTPPDSSVVALPEFSRATGFMVQWKATDDISEPYSINLQAKEQSTDWVEIAWREFWHDDDLTATLSIARGPFPPGEKLFYRTSSKDWALNDEPYPEGDGDTWTTTFYTRMNALIQDIRDAPVINSIRTASGALNSFLPELNHHFQAFFADTGISTVTVDHPAYGTLPAVNVSMKQDVPWQFILPPKDNLILNGNFEKDGGGTQNWLVEGEPPSTSLNAYSGSTAVQLGKDCLEGCYAEPETMETNNPQSVVVDQMGTVHLINGYLNYTYRMVNGVWATPIILDPNALDISRLFIDRDDNLYVIINYLHDSWLWKKEPGGNWIKFSEMPFSIFFHTTLYDLAVLESGDLIYAIDKSQLDYQMKVFWLGKDGKWTAIVDKMNLLQDGNAIKIGEDGSVHRIGKNLFFVWYEEFMPDGTELPTVILGEAVGGGAFLGVDQNQGIHAIVGDMYFYRSPQTEWSGSLAHSVNSSMYFGITAPDGGLWINTNQNPVRRFLHKPAGEGGFEEIDYPPVGERRLVGGGFDREGIFHQVWSEYSNPVYIHGTKVVATLSSGIAQSIQIPIEMHKPTLSFNYKILAQSQQDQPGLLVEILPSSGIPQQVFSSSGPAGGWQHAWVDLSAWSGQEINVRFTYKQIAGHAESGVLLDNITAGSWLTPIAYSIHPYEMKCPSTQPVELMVSGENFIEYAQVTLNGQPIDTAFLNETTLIATLPAGTICGFYSVVVTNPQGQQSVVSGGLNLFNRIYLPRISR